MKTLLKTYTHPVIGNGDDFMTEVDGGRFDVMFTVQASEDKRSWLISFAASMTNTALNKLINTGFAAYHLEVECANTFYRESFQSRDQNAQFTIPADRLRGKVLLDISMVALQQIEEYQPADVHEDYGDKTFEISVGDILGIGGSKIFIADTEFDPLRASANSFIKIERGTKAKGNIEALHGPNEIIIRLPHEDYDRFQDVAGQTLIADILHAAIVFPVLLEAVQFAQRRHNDHNDRLLAILEQRGLMHDEPFDAAQKILQAPVSRALLKLQEIKEANS